MKASISKYVIQDYIRNMLFLDETRVVLAPVVPGFKLYTSSETEHTTEIWQAAMDLLDAGMIVECSVDAYEWFGNCVPCLEIESNAFLNGEPCFSLKTGENVYIAGLRSNNRYFLQQCTQKQFKEHKAFKRVILL